MASENTTETVSVDVTLQGLDVAKISAHTLPGDPPHLTWLRIGGGDARVTLLGAKDDLWRALSHMAQALAETAQLDTASQS
jgi:hypothetical protein